MTSRPVERPSRLPVRMGSAGAWVTRSAAPLVGFIAGVIAFAGSGIPSFWGDEAASVLSAERSVPSLLALLGHIDAVHGLYYLFLHGWIGLVGTSEAAVRFPSAVAVALAAAGTVVLGTRLAGRATGVLAGCVLAVLPIVTRLGIEARSYAFTMAAAVWLVVWFVTLVRRREARWWAWAAFAAASAVSLYLFLYLALLAVVQLAVLAVYRAPRATVLRWLAASVATAVLAAPIVAIGAAQREQIAFLARRDYATVDSVVVRQWFGSSPWVAVAAWSLIVVAIVAALFLRRMRPARRAALVGGVWLVVPTAVVLAANAWLTPTYNLRYLSFCAPAVALLVAIGLRGLGALAASAAPVASRPGAVGGRRAVPPATLVPLLGLAVILGAATPGYLAQRGPYAKDHGADFRQAAAVVAANASPGDAIVFDQSTKPSRRPRLSLDLYPGQFAGLDDVALRRPLASRTVLWDAVAPLPAVADRVEAHARVWAVESGSDSTDVAVLRSLGYTVEQAIPVHRTVVYELVKEGS